MELRHLRYFVAVAEELSFTRAARRLHVAQPALSVQIRQLEAEIGVALVDRSRRAIRLTPAGSALLDEFRRHLAGIEQTLDIVRRIGTGVVGHLGVGFIPSAANSALPPLLRSFRAGHPGVIIDLREMTPDDLVDALHGGRLDIGFLYLPLADRLLETRVVLQESFMVAIPDSHPLATAEAIAVGDLRDEPFILPARHRMPGLHAQVLEICREAGFSPAAVQEEVWQIQTIVGLVAASIGVALVPAGAEALARRGVVYRALDGVGRHDVQLAAAWKQESSSPVLAAFVEEIARNAPAVVTRSAPRPS